MIGKIMEPDDMKGFPTAGRSGISFSKVAVMAYAGRVGGADSIVVARRG